MTFLGQVRSWEQSAASSAGDVAVCAALDAALVASGAAALGLKASTVRRILKDAFGSGN